MDEGLWDAYDRMGLSFQEHAADSAYNAHYDRPAVPAALGPVKPVPAESMRERYPEDYEKLSKEPGFLILRLLKPPIPDPGTPG